MTTTLLGAGLAALALPATAAAPTTCQGKPVTVTGIVGTEGDDVMVIEPGQYTTAQGLGGNDLICLVATPTVEWRNVGVDAGPGDDTVINESTDLDAVTYRIVLGEGADTYRGLVASVPDRPDSVLIEEVSAGLGTPGMADTAPDTIETGGGNDTVWSGSTILGALNADVVRTGAGDDTLHWAGEQNGGVVDVGAGANSLQLERGWQATSVVVDASRHLATGDGRPVLQWAGDLADVILRLGNRDVSYVGTDAAESLVMESVVGIAMAPTADMSRSASMGGGDDSLVLVATGSGTVDGGPGRDRFYSDTCTTVRARLEGTFSCVPRIASEVTHTFGFADWEDLLVRGQDVSLRGSDRAERMKAVGDRIRLRGRGGADVLNPNGGFGTEGKPVVVSGGRGDDRVLGTPQADVLRGGPGDDKLFGQGGDDTLQGGTGRDKAVGKDGRDRCSAEVRVSCERR
ncbi:calcium-binding protein [Nocardioides sp. BE266]|uniref:calcium-binding protein n=1 Tax=Nocardioides sp. BE266 TaxID=2817725 RepID=UPI00286AA8A4|nr:calcium-binding protein [Nocardioides sp. BE266]